MSELLKPNCYITIGASAGGLNAISEVISNLPVDLNAAVFVVLHLSKVGVGEFLIHRLQKYTNYKCKIPADGETIEANYIYLAPPDKHLLVKDDKVILGLGPAENRWRPSIDVLFRSAAASHTEQVIGIVLTGFLNDGTSGMWAIKRSGGKCIVQDPNEAEYPDMPLSVIESMEVDYCIPLREMGAAIQEINANAIVTGIEVPADVLAESEIAEKVVTSVERMNQLGDQTTFICPDCGGNLWHMPHDVIERYRCHIGHTYTQSDLLIKQGEHMEETLWVALRMMEERRDMLRKIAEKEGKKGLTHAAKIYHERIQDLEKHVEKLKQILFDSHANLKAS